MDNYNNKISNLPYLADIKALNIAAPYNLIAGDNADMIPKINNLNDKVFDKYLKIAKQYEPLLQPGMLFNNIDGLKIIDDIKKSKIKDVLLMTFAPRSCIFESYLELAKNIVTKLNVIEDDYGKIIDLLNYEVLNSQEIQNELKDVEVKINNDFDKYKNSEDFLNDKQEFIKRYNIQGNDEIVDRLVLNQKLKMLVENSDIATIMDKNLTNIVSSVNQKNPNLNIGFKDPMKTAEHDGYALGAPASGKGQVVKNYLLTNKNEQNKETIMRNTIIINPDTTRIFSVNKLFNNTHIPLQTLRENNAFITNGVGDIVEAKCTNSVVKETNRDLSVILDKTSMNVNLIQNTLKPNAKIVMGAYYGSATPTTGPAFRAYNRGMKSENAIDARLLRNTFTLESHRDYLTNIIKNNSPDSVKNDIIIVDTAGKDLSPGHKSVEIAIIHKDGEIEVKDPRFIEFIAKSNININAKHPIEVSMVQSGEDKKWIDKFQSKDVTKQEKLEMLRSHKSDGKLFYNFEDKIKAAEDFGKLAESKGFKVNGMNQAIKDYEQKEIYKNFNNIENDNYGSLSR